MKKPKKQPMSQGDQKMKEYHESLQEEGLRKMREANPLMERSTFLDSWATAGYFTFPAGSKLYEP